MIRLSNPPQLQPMPNSCMPSSIASMRSFATGCNTMENNPDAPMKSRFHNSWPREPGSAG